jgi:UrcA family protein
MSERLNELGRDMHTHRSTTTMNAQRFGKTVIGSMTALVGTFALALSAQAGEASADATVKHDDVVVRYADLDLASEEGAETLYARLSSAAARACGNTPMAWEHKARKDFKACFDRKLEKAVGKVGHPNVQAVHAVRKEASKVG